MTGIQELPPKMAAAFAERAKAGEGLHVGAHCYDFVQGNNVVTLVSLDPPIGHVSRDPAQAKKIAEQLKERSK